MTAPTRRATDPDDWDYDNPTRHEPAKNPRAIVSVAFSRAEFDQITAAAKARDMKLSAYIRESTLRCQQPRPEVATPHSPGGATRGTRTQGTKPRLLRWLP